MKDDMIFSQLILDHSALIQDSLNSIDFHKAGQRIDIYASL